MSLRPLLCLLACLCGGLSHATAAELDATEAAIAEAIAANVADAEALLEQVVNTNSGTLNSQGVRAVGAVFAERFRALDMDVSWIELPEEMDRAGHLVARSKHRGGPQILLIGHLDTVFEADSPFQRFERLDNGNARGPGVTDMKGGDVVIDGALKALHEAGALDRIDVTVIMTGDEKKPGRPIEITRAALLEAGMRADYILGFENNLDLSSATVARRGSSGWSVQATGIRGHSSQVFSDALGAGAIFELARILDGFYSHVRGERYLTFNPGVIVGGTDVRYDDRTSSGSAFGKTNVVAQSARVDGGLRFITEDQKERARDAMRRVVAAHLPGTSATITFSDGYPAMPPSAGNLELFAELDAISRALGQGALTQVDPGSRGAADISFVGQYAPSLAGLGPVGEQLHAEGEQLVLASLPVVTQRAALLILRLSER
ncbi:MAG TPA: M20/M25/M40 family metallo-hydrolase [Pseudomonadales bacterium]|nr:M20/M25/M40 family metallo-hydrolase [Pseudomonadales bacterium]